MQNFNVGEIKLFWLKKKVMTTVKNVKTKLTKNLNNKIFTYQNSSKDKCE